ncbi:MAG: DUF4143 domain-containing protein [Planctomycetes bacterium]|jgi:predicted AAA+ superfamily ATPase|nr:DUF4143 domain-containing protein [Planctomycetota bacterium]
MSRIARECAVSVKTVQQYYEILEETFLALRVPGWNRSGRRRLVAHPRFYLFDPGVTNALCHTLGENLDPVTRGRRFEQFVAQRISAEIHYAKLDAGIAYWRTNHGAEVDFLLHRGSRILGAIEVRSGRHAARDPLTGLRNFAEEHPQVPRFLLLPEARPRLLDEGVRVLSWNDFLRDVLPGL